MRKFLFFFIFAGAFFGALSLKTLFAQDYLTPHNPYEMFDKSYAGGLLFPSLPSREPFSEARFFTNEAFRAATFGANKIARDLFYRACVLGDELGCVGLNAIHAPQGLESRFIAKDECDLGAAEACFKIYRYYATETTLDDFKARWYLAKACRLGHSEACALELSMPRDFIASSRQLLNEECFRNNAFACYKLADIYLFGRGVAHNRAFARDLLKKSCQNGYFRACQIYMQIQK